MSCLDHIHIEIVIEKNRTTDGSDAHCPLSYLQFINDLTKEVMDDTMSTARTLMGANIEHTLRAAGYFLHNIFLISPKISSAVGTSPPILP